MSRILIFAGTTEGRELAEVLSDSGVYSDVSVATEYGSMVMNESEFIHVHQGRLDAEGMKKLYSEVGCDVVIDATHPYAEEVTQTIIKSVKDTGLSYIRLLRDHKEMKLAKDMITYYESAKECAKALEQTEGRILLTTGSKELAVFTENESLRKRLVVRVLPGMESLGLCYEAGLEGKQIIAMQGPFSHDMNKVMIKQYDIKHLVTKESGKTGGEDTKLTAAMEMGINVSVIERPVQLEEGHSIEETAEMIEKILGVSLVKGKQLISFAGIGCGALNGMTEEVRDAIETADYIFGAKRMLGIVDSSAEKYPYYLAKDIIPILGDIKKKSLRNTRIVILFSGDTGFYSGAEKLYQSLKDRPDTELRILPGISSISMFASRLGISWQDAKLLSLHGVEESKWVPRLIDSVRYEKKTMLICSGAADIRSIGEVLLEMDSKESIAHDLKIYVGYQLSYSDEELRLVTIEELQDYTREGLYVVAILRSSPKERELIPFLADEDFIRGKVPMTKEEVRLLSIARLRLKRGDIFYDIGSGTGSIAISVSRLSPDIRVYAIECKEEAAELIKENKGKFLADNITLIQKTAPEGLDALPKADATFIGGSKGNLSSILEKLYEINPNMRIVMNAVSMESIVEMNNCLKDIKVKDLKISQIAVTNVKELGEYHMMSANNPVFIYSFSFAG